jgi:hypothetical protein
MIEEWKDIELFIGKYQISSLGRVKSLDRNVYRKDGTLAYKQQELIICQYGKIYNQVNLYKEGKLHHFYTHILLAKHFILNPKNKEQVNHIDGNKKNNSLSNLEWVTKSENAKHAYDVLGIGKYRIYKKGLDNKLSKSVNQYDLNNNFIKKWDNITQAMKSLNNKKASISLCCNGKLKKSAGYKWEFSTK